MISLLNGKQIASSRSVIGLNGKFFGSWIVFILFVHLFNKVGWQ